MSKQRKSQQLFEDQYSMAARRIRLYLIRHGQPEEHTESTPDPGLTPLGKKQAAAVAERLKQEFFNVAYISPLARAMQTAEPLLNNDAALRAEITADIKEISKEHMLVHLHKADASIRAKLEIERDTLHRFVNRLRHSHQAGEQVLIVAHGNLIRTLIPLLGTREPADSILMELYHASLCIVDLWPLSGRAVMILGNCTSHLNKTQVTF